MISGAFLPGLIFEDMNSGVGQFFAGLREAVAANLDVRLGNELGAAADAFRQRRARRLGER